MNFVPNGIPALTPSDEYVPHKFFVKNITGFLAPVYSDNSEEISANAHLDFMKYWAYNSQKIIEALELVEHIGDSMGFMGTHPPRMLGMSTLLSEVYRSAYIRTLQHFFDIDLIQIDMFHKYALATMPVELSIWKIKPNRAPGWWPKLKHETAKESYDNKIVGFEFPFNEVEQLINERQDFKIIGINGTIEPKNGWNDGVLDTAIHLAGFAYRTIGPDIPDAKMLAVELFYRTFIFSVPRIVKRPFSILECSDKFLPSQNEPYKIDDLLIYPIIAPIRDFPINLWQWFRGYHPFMVLFKSVSASNLLNIESDRLCYYREGKLIARSLDWTQGIKERCDLEIPHGTYIEADAKYLNEYLENIGFKLGYVVKISHKFRKYTTDKEQIIEDHRLINVSKIIV